MRAVNAILLGALLVAASSVATAANINDGGREPARIRMDCAWTKSATKARCSAYEVPAGKRLVVETMRVDAFLTPSADVIARFADTEDGSSVSVPLRKQAGRYMLYGRRIVAEPGTKLNIDYRPSAELRQIPASGTTTIQLLGFFEPAL